MSLTLNRRFKGLGGYCAFVLLHTLTLTQQRIKEKSKRFLAIIQKQFIK